MIIKKCGVRDFSAALGNRKIVAFGASILMQVISDNYKELGLEEKVSYIIDNDPNKNGTKYQLGQSMKDIHSPDYLLNDNLENIAILLASDAYAYEMYRQLEDKKELENVPCFCLSTMLMSNVDDTCEHMDIPSTQNIPKIIHCFWFSGDEKDDLSKRCMESWRKYCPDYEIKEWNTTNYDVTKNPYMYEAFKARKWAYVTDYARLDMVHEYGGFYFDLDLELVKSIDPLLGASFVAGFGPIRDVELAAFGAEKGFAVVAKFLKGYEDRVFDPGQKLTLKDVQPLYIGKIMERMGFEINGKYQNREGVVLLPRDSFSPRNWFTGEVSVEQTSYGIHHCAGGWASREENKKKQQNMMSAREIFT
ncbi:glycosyltransferase family 32 protein [Butyrivibrio sp. VCB2006]|uniref:glycosyltransferase family 32 protein n=1 Tax=Butyrivibrio sp. VCB2006 TaxID=1280679 RepID=UPI0004059B8F|nr:glycosyltransferase [Butyrivibrio sp. VCB2006]